MIRRAIDVTYKTARRIAVLTVGSTILLLGIVLLVTPGPGLIVIPIGLAILGIEFAWARRWLKRVREGISNHAARSRAAKAGNHRERVGRRD